MLGWGGMGMVLEAYDARLDRNLAIKLLHPHLAHLVHLHHVGMRQAGQRLCLPNEPSGESVRKVRVQQLDRQVAIEARVVRLEDHAHPAPTQHAPNIVPSQ
ncbi:MAG: hypothetical protein AAGF11_56590, partial [Myxococcota bacterium]